MGRFDYTPKGVCSRKISFDLEDGKLSGVSFEGGCNGNLKAISKLLEGQSAAEAVRILKGNDCNGRGTSCADQLAQAVEKALAQEQ
ncbi:MAG: TIGR03905 family TSCPD domain-containing protein [Ruminococcus sp.]|nr:TIGR03905 family TSCPD domain-containing protein [Ruminococcus sp.]